MLMMWSAVWKGSASTTVKSVPLTSTSVTSTRRMGIHIPWSWVFAPTSTLVYLTGAIGVVLGMMYSS